MATASDYLKYNNPINSPSDPGRGFSDQIYIDFTSGKKSLDEQLKEVELANKQLALEQQKLMPTDAAAQEFGWSKAPARRAADQAVFDRQIAQSEEARRAQSAVYEGEQNKRQNIATRQSKKEFKFNKKMSKQDLALKQSSEARQSQESSIRTQAAQQEMAQNKALAPYQLQAIQADLAYKQQQTAAVRQANQESYAKAHPPASGTMQYYTPPPGATAAQLQIAKNSINNPNYIPAGASYNLGAGSTKYGSGYDTKTGKTWYY